MLSELKSIYAIKTMILCEKEDGLARAKWSFAESHSPTCDFHSGISGTGTSNLGEILHLFRDIGLRQFITGSIARQISPPSVKR